MSWLTRAHIGYQAAGREADWRVYLSEVHDQHSCRYKVMAMLQEFVRPARSGKSGPMAVNDADIGRVQRARWLVEVEWHTLAGAWDSGVGLQELAVNLTKPT